MSLDPGALAAPFGSGASPVDPALASGGDSPLGAIADLTPSTPVLVPSVIALGGAAAIAAVAGRSGVSAEARMAFTNVRLLPCFAKASAERHLGILTQLVDRGGGGAAQVALNVGGGAVLQAGGLGSGAPPDDAHEARDAKVTALSAGREASFLGPLREGFGRRSSTAATIAEEGLSDSRLMVQIGVLLGFVYLGFLTVWFWATRGPRAPWREPAGVQVQEEHRWPATRS